jgi:hypothetical protein
MAYAQPQAWYVHSGDMATTGYWAVPAYSNKAWTVGQLCRPLTAQAVGNERVYVCTTAGTSSAEPTWAFTKGVLQTATGGVVFQECSGECALNGDLTNAIPWAASSTPVLGRVIYDPTSNSIQICTVSAAGAASKPTFSATAGVVTSDGATAKWTSLGLASAWSSNWAAPMARLSSATIANAGAAGNDFYVADNSLEVTTVAVVLNIGSTTAASRVMSVDRAAPTTLKAGASITCNLASANIIIFGSGANTAGSYYGMTFVATLASGSPIISLSFLSTTYHRFENCSFQAGAGTNINGIICVGTQTSGVSGVDLINCTFGFIAVGQGIQLGGGPITWRNTPNPCLVNTSTIPNPLLKPNANTPANVLIEGVDLSAAGSVTLINNATSSTLFTIKNCKLHTGAIVGVIAAGAPTLNIDVVGSDTGALTYRNERYNVLGQTTTNTAVVRTGGASDGTTLISHSLQPTGFARVFRPYISLPLVIWNDVVGTARTLTLYGAINGSAVLPRNDQFWFDVEYMGTSGLTIASLVTNGQATPLTAASTVAVADAVSSWSGLGGTNAPFSLAVTFTAQQKGYVTIYPKAGASYSLYLDPKPVLT